MVALLFILRGGRRVLLLYISQVVHQQMKNTHLSASSKERGDRAAVSVKKMFRRSTCPLKFKSSVQN